MATPAQIQAALADAQAASLSWGEMAVLLKRAIVNAQINGSGTVQIPIQSTASDGTSVTMMSITEAAKLAAKWESMDYGGVVSQYAELRAPGEHCQ